MNSEHSVTISPILSRIEKLALTQHLNQIGIGDFETIDWGWTTTVVFDQKSWFTLSLKYHNIEEGLVKGLRKYKRLHYQTLVDELCGLNPHLSIADFNCHGPLVLDEPGDV